MTTLFTNQDSNKKQKVDDFSTSTCEVTLDGKDAPTAVEVANFFLVIDDNSIDPLKLQKLMYLAFAFAAVNLKIELWDNLRHPLIKNYHGPLIREVHNNLNGYIIPKSSHHPNSKSVSLDPLRTAVISAVYKKFRNYSGIELQDRCHLEKPWMRAFIGQSLRLCDIFEEYSEPRAVNEFWYSMLINTPENILNGLFRPYLTKVLNSASIDFVVGLVTCWCSLPLYAQSFVAKILYPTELRQNYDPKSNLYGRPDVIKRVALSYRFGLKTAGEDLTKILGLFSVDEEDCYNKWTKEVRTKILQLGEEDGDIDKPDGFQEYLSAGECENFEEAWELYQKSLDRGYARAAFELAKMKPVERVTYLKRAFDLGMLTVTDLLIAKSDLPLPEMSAFLEKRGELGDPMGYYKLGQLYESVGDLVKAEKYYVLASPFYGLTELKNYNNVSCRSLNEFFEEVMEIANEI